MGLEWSGFLEASEGEDLKVGNCVEAKHEVLMGEIRCQQTQQTRVAGRNIRYQYLTVKGHVSLPYGLQACTSISSLPIEHYCEAFIKT